MFKALYDYGKAHPGILCPPGCRTKKVKYLIELDGNGDFIDVRPASEGEQSVVAPCVESAAHQPDVCIEKACVVLSITDDMPAVKMGEVSKKHDVFITRLDSTGVAELDAVHRAMSDVNIFEAMAGRAMDIGVKSGDMVGFVVSGAHVHGSESVRRWWASVSSGQEEACAIDMVTGEPCVPARLFKPVPAAVVPGGQASGTFIVSFNAPAFESYGNKQGMNAPVSQETADIIMDSFIHLAGRSVNMGGLRFIHWYDRDVDDDLLAKALIEVPDDDGTDFVNEAGKDAAATALVRSPLTGVPVGPLTGNQYHIMTVKPEGSRLSIRDYEVGDYEELYGHLCDWFSGMELVNWDGRGSCKYKSMNGILYSLLKENERKSGSDKFSGVRPLSSALLRACLDGSAIPYGVASRALDAVTSAVYSDGKPWPASIQVLKLWLCRNENEKEGVSIMSHWNPENRNVGYLCGGLLAVYEHLQKTVNRSVGNGVGQRYYSACLRSPRVGISQMSKLSMHHFPQLSSGYRKRVYETMLEEIYGKMDGDIPTSLSMADKAYFAVGYWQAHAEIEARMNFSKTAGDSGNDNQEV